MIHTVRLYIEKFRLLADIGPVVVGLSGGADSVALLGILVRLGYPCVSLHCNFHLRGEESERDERFARDFADLLSVPFYKTDFDTNTYASEHHVSIEMAARELRYAWFEEMRQRLGAQAIAVAHHRDDSVETILMNLVRGTGIRGMRGICPRNGAVVRPLLGVGRDDILCWLSEQGYSFVTDSTNLSDDYTRNFIRLNVIPLLEKINPSARDTVARSAEHLSATEEIYLHVVEQAKREVMLPENRVSISALMRYPAPQTILYELLKPFGFTRLVTGDIFAALSKESGKTFYSPDYRLLKDRDCLIITLTGEKEEQTFTLCLDKGIWRGPIELSFDEVVISKGFPIEKNKNIAYFDRDKLRFPLTLRTWKEGDWFIPFGMKGRKKLSDYFSDHKFSRVQKERTWLLCSGDAIIWIVGERTDERFRVDESTKCALVLKKLG